MSATGRSDVPEIVCLCGSTRFEDAFKEAQFRLTVEGKIVLTVAGNWKDDHDDVWDQIDDEQKEALDELHFRKIDLSDRVFVLNVDGYVGSSTRNEVQHALETGTEVSWLEPENVPEEFEDIDEAECDEPCLTCLGRGYITRRYGTVGSGPAARTHRDPCPDCSDDEVVQ